MAAWRVTSSIDDRIVEADDAGGAYLAFVAGVHAGNAEQVLRCPVERIERLSSKAVLRFAPTPAGSFAVRCSKRADGRECGLLPGHEGMCSRLSI